VRRRRICGAVAFAISLARVACSRAAGRAGSDHWPSRGSVLNVLFFTSWYPTREFTYGGVFVREHAKAVRVAGHRVVVLHLAGQRRKLDGGYWKMEEESDPSLSEGIEAHHVFHRQSRVPGASYALQQWSAIAAYRQVRANGFRPDVIHAHVYGAGVPAARICTRSGTPLVVTEHFSGVARRSLSSVEARKARYAYKRAARVLPVSRFLEEAIRSYGVDAHFEVVPNVVDTSLFFPPDTERREANAGRRLLFVGSLEPAQYKGFPTLLEALDLLRENRRDWQLEVIGEGSERASYEASAAALGLRERLTFRGSQPKPVVAQMMRSADLFVLPSRLETFGTAIVEGLASGLPVVSTTAGAIPELVDEHNGRLVPPDDPAALAAALNHALERIDEFDRPAIADRARHKFSAEVVGGQLGRIYEAVIAESKARTAPRAEQLTIS
jgi:glycosyltransferase involved in cell wall biosynthesis